MFKKITIGAALAASTLAVAPAPALASHDGYYDGGRYERSYRGDNYYRGRSYYRGQRRCSGTTGTIIGGVAGALLGREITRDNRGWNRNSGTTGAIVGGAPGALARRAIDRGC